MNKDDLRKELSDFIDFYEHHDCDYFYYTIKTAANIQLMVNKESSKEFYKTASNVWVENNKLVVEHPLLKGQCFEKISLDELVEKISETYFKYTYQGISEAEQELLNCSIKSNSAREKNDTL